jgi:signal transduction histidine kinase
VDEYRRVLRLVHDRADDLRKMVESLLFLARADAHAHVPSPETFDLVGWLETHLTGWADHPRRADVRVVTPREPVLVRAHPVLAGQLLDNLLDNALKHGFPDTEVTVTIGSRDGGGVCEVSDHGPGIPAADLPRLFDPFFRTDDARLRGVPGVGLGLAIARRLAEAVGGRVTAESEPGRGSRFTLWLPAPVAGT